MERINTPTSSNGRFVDGNKALGTLATQFSAEWCNMVQEEICNLIKLITGNDPTGQSEDELANAFGSFLGEFGLKSITFKKFAAGSNAVSVVSVDGEKVDIKAEGSAVTENSHASFGRTGFYYEKSSSEPARTYKVEVDPETVKVTDANPGGTFTTEIKGGIVRVKRGNSGVEISYDKVATPKLFIKFDPENQDGSLAYQKSSMTLCESEEGVEKPTEYFAAVNPGADRDYFVLDSTLHEIGAVVLIRNVGTSSNSLLLYRAGDSSKSYPLCEVPARSTRCIVYRGLESSAGSGSVPVWDVM